MGQNLDQATPAEDLCPVLGIRGKHLEKLAAHPSRRHAAQQPQAQQPRGQVATDVQMQDISRLAHQQARGLQRALRIVHVVSRLLAMPCEVDHRRLVPVAAQVVVDGHDVGLHAAVRRRIRAELDDPHPDREAKSMGTAASVRADSSMRRQAGVARAPSSTVVRGLRPSRMAATKSWGWGRYPLGHDPGPRIAQNCVVAAELGPKLGQSRHRPNRFHYLPELLEARWVLGNLLEQALLV